MASAPRRRLKFKAVGEIEDGETLLILVYPAVSDHLAPVMLNSRVLV